MSNKTEQIGFFVTLDVKQKLQKLAIEHNRTMSGQLTEMINRDYKKFLSAQLRADQTKPNTLSNRSTDVEVICPECGHEFIVYLEY